MNPNSCARLYTPYGRTINLTMEEHTHLMACLCDYWGPSESLDVEVAETKRPAQVCDSNIIYVDFSSKTPSNRKGVMM